MKKLFAILCCLIGTLALSAQSSEGLVLHYDFSNVENKNVPDLSATGAHASLKGGASVVEVGKYFALDLGKSNGYLDLTKEAGTMFRGLTDYTISCYYYIQEKTDITAAGNFLWSFSTSTATTQTSGSYIAYRVNKQRMASANKGWETETGIELGTASDKGRWVHFVYLQRGSTGEIYLDGKKVASAEGIKNPTETYTINPRFCFIGRPAFSSDQFLKNTRVMDFRMYDRALSTQEVNDLAAQTADIEEADKYGVPGDAAVLNEWLEKAKVVVADEQAGYAPNAVAELQDEVLIAESEVKRGLSQIYIDQCVTKVKEVYNRCIKTKEFQLLEVREFPNQEHGFVHPGGLHTQADFDRIKQLLAEGDPTVKAAWDLLCRNEYAQSNVVTWPTWEIMRSGKGDNYMNVARGAAMAYQNALRWKIAGTEEHARNGVHILMKWARENDHVAGNTNASLAFGLYGYELAQAAELLRDYPGWSKEDFEEFKNYIKRTWYLGTIDFLRRRHDTWANPGNSHGERPGHYWSNWGLCCAMAVASYGVLLDDVHIYNQGMSFFKYDHVGTWQNCVNKKDNIVNWGLNEYIGNLVVCLHDDARGPFGKLGQMQECGRDQGHANMALGLALDICQMGLSQGDDLFAYMDDRMAAGIEWMAAYNFGGLNDLPWTPYNYADRGGYLNMGWQMDGPNESSRGQWRPIWWRALGYYEGVRGITPQYTRKAAETVGVDGGGGNYGQTSGGFDHLGFSALTSYRKKIAPEEAAVVLTGKIQYKGETLQQTDLGGLKYTYSWDGTHAIPCDGAEITLMPELPEGVADNGQWYWETGERTRNLTVKADHSYIYRVHYTCDNGAEAVRAFSIAVAGDCEPDLIRPEITIDGVITADTLAHVFYGQELILYMGTSSGFSNDYRWDNGVTGANQITIPNLTSSRTYTCQFVNQGGRVNEVRFHLIVDKVRQFITVNDTETQSNEKTVLSGTEIRCRLQIPASSNPDDVVWQDGSRGLTYTIDSLTEDRTLTATFEGETYTFELKVQGGNFTYYQVLSPEKGYSLITSTEEMASRTNDCYFVMASQEADLLLGLKDAPLNGNKALFYQETVNPAADLTKVFTMEAFDDGFCMRNIDYDGLLLQTELNRPDQWRTHDQPLACNWARLLLHYDGVAWTVENGTYNGNWLGLWNTNKGYTNGQELACNRSAEDLGRFQFFAIPKALFHQEYLTGATAEKPIDATPLILNPAFTANGLGWTMKGTWGNQRYNGATEVWHSTNFSFTQQLQGLPAGLYTLTCQMVNGEGANTGFLFAESNGTVAKDVVKASCVGSNFNAERDRMAASAKYGLLSVDVPVTDGSLTFGIQEPTAGTTWLVWDNFTLTYKGAQDTALDEVWVESSHSLGTYDLQGRRVGNAGNLKRGIYVIDGRKRVVK